ncbi:beta strand repeat-containing protein, partial [Kordiimonas sp.]|uniref:beta strand repeat-containing protein n=1 Tax=Kordiimonas sp. TaxID=1970157 RepID=UPI003A8EA45F
ILLGAFGSNDTYLIFGSGDAFSASFDLSDLDGTNGLVLDGASGDNSGISVAAAGDVNGDGFDDLLIGATEALPYFGGSGEGKAYVVFGTNAGFDASLDLSTLDGSDGFVIHGINDQDFTGANVSSAGDINGDGYDDIIIGAYGADPNGSYSGQSYIVFGSGDGFAASMNASSLDGTNGFTISGGASDDRFATFASSAGDINGDGYDDIVFGTQVGKSYVVYGAEGGFDAALDLSSLDGTNGFVIVSVNADDGAGGPVSAAGDINGDGYGDLLIGAPQADPNGSGSGSAYLVYGSEAGFGSSFELSSLNGTNGFVINGSNNGYNAGASVSAAGDLNGDGFDDILVGASGADTNASDSGSTYVIFGSPSIAAVPFHSASTVSFEENATGTVIDVQASIGFGANDDGLTYSIGGEDAGFFEIDDETGELTFASAPDYEGRADNDGDGIYEVTVLASDGGQINGQQTLAVTVTDDESDNLSGVLNLFSLEASEGFVINGVGAGDASGISVSGAGDINGDGIEDLIIGARGADINGESSGSAYVVFGSDSGFNLSLDLSDLDGTNGFTLNGVDTSDQLGISVSAAGDINGDGIEDIVVGANLGDPNGQQSGETYVVFGSDSGFSATLDLSSLDGSNGFTLNGVDAYDLSGYSVSSAGDINGDGIDDILIGALRADPNASSSGETYVVFGSDEGFSATLELSSLDGTNGFVINGTGDNKYTGQSLSAAGDVNGDGIDDILIGGSASNSSENGSAYVVFGSDSEFAAVLELSSLDGTNGFALNGPSSSDFVGRSVANLGDINGDGIDDIIVGGHGVDTSNSSSGASYVVFGSNTSFAAAIDLSTLDGTNGFVINGVDTNDGSGRAVAGAGDINGDGFNDILIGAMSADPYSLTSAGEVYVVYGTDTAFSAAFELADLEDGDQSTGFVIAGVNAGDQLGISLSSADINGDGVDDIIVGAYYGDPNGLNSGETYVIYGVSVLSPAVIGGDISASITEDKTGTTGGTLTITDANGEDEESFNSDTLEGTYGELVITANGDWVYDLDQSSSTVQGLGTGSSLTDTITVSSVDGTEQDITITITGVNDAPSGPRLSASTVAENQAGVLIGTLSSSDAEGSPIQFSTTDTRFTISGNQLSLKSGVSLDFEATPTVTITVTATDGDGLSRSASVTISVTDVAEPITGTDGSDSLSGGEASDTLSGGNGDDSLEGGDGNDLLLGGDGSDNLSAGNGDDKVWAGATDESSDTLAGGNGNDRMGAGLGDDSLDGESGDDTLYASGGNDTVFGGEGNDVIFNGSGDDVVDGGSGNDTMWAGAGDDTLTGGDGSDTFIFATLIGHDTILDFDADEDILDFTLLGRGLTSSEDILAAASSATVGGQSGVLIDLGDDDSVFLAGVSLGDISTITMEF